MGERGGAGGGGAHPVPSGISAFPVPVSPVACIKLISLEDLEWFLVSWHDVDGQN